MSVEEEYYVPKIHPRKHIKESHPNLQNLLNPEIDLERWWEEGNCLGMDPNLFYPERGKSTKEPKEICSNCPVQLHCALESLENNEKHGIWGGLSERERRRIRRQRKDQRKHSDAEKFLATLEAVKGQIKHNKEAKLAQEARSKALRAERKARAIEKAKNKTIS